VTALITCIAVASTAIAQPQPNCLSLAPLDQHVGALSDASDPITLNPPTDRDLPITIRDVRLLPDGRLAEFTIRNRLRFVRGEGGMIATLRRDAVDCVGPEPICGAYRGAMAAWTGSIQRFAVTPDGRIATLIRADLVGVGEGSPEAIALISAAEQRNPGMLGEAELREAMRYIGQDMGDNLRSDPAGSERDHVTVGRRLDNQLLVWSRSTAPINTSDDESLSSERCDLVDLDSGLLLDSVIVSKASGDTGPPISDRRWTLGL
jgi:hypothetical protein